MAAALMLGLAACSDDEVDSASPAASTSSAPGSPTSTATPSGTGSPSDTAAPEVVPASGMALETQDAVRVHMPEGDWVSVGDGTRTVVTATNFEAGPVEITLAEFPTSSTDPEDIAKVDVKTYRQFKDGARITRQDDREVLGLTGWVLTGADKEYTYYRFGTIHAGVFVTISFILPRGLPDPDAFVESVLASVTWK